jgi:putative peptidoglycan lipid II flippase
VNSEHRQIARAAGIVMAAFVASRLLGLARDMVIAAQLGTSDAADAYRAAFLIPDLIFTLIAGGALASAFIPTFTGYLANGDREGAWHLASAVINLLIVTTGVAAVLAAIFAPAMMWVLAPGFSAEKQALTISLMRVTLICSVIFGVSGLVMGVLNAQQQFFWPGLAPAMYNIGIILGAWLLLPRLGPMGVAIGAVAGALLHLLVQVPGLVRCEMRYTPVLSLRDPGVRRVLWLMGPRVFGLAVVQLNFWVETNLASRLGMGAVAALNYAFRVMLLPQGVFAQGVATAAFPTFAEQAARGHKDAMSEALAATLRAIFFVAIPAAVGLLVLRMPLIQALFERGKFQDSSTEAVALALMFYAPGLVAHSGIEIVTRAFYALHDTRTPVYIGVVAMLVNVALSLSLIGPMQIAGLALANSIAAFAEMALLLWFLRPRVSGLGSARTWTALGKSAFAAAVMAAAVWAFLAFAPAGLPGGAILRGGIGVVIGGAVYVLASLLVGADEVRTVTRMVLRRA